MGFDLARYIDGSVGCFVHTNATLFAIKQRENVVGVDQYTRQECNVTVATTTPATAMTTTSGAQREYVVRRYACVIATPKE